MSRIFKRDSIKVDGDNKVVIVHDNLPENVRMFDESSSSEAYDFDYKKAVEVAKIMADEILTNAKNEAEEIKQNAINSADKIIEDAEASKTDIYDEYKTNGYDDGYEKGLDEGRKLGESEYESKLKDILQDKEELIKERQDLIENTEADIVDTVLDIVSNLTYGAFQLNPELLSVLVKRGISNATIQKKVSIKVSSEDYDDVVKNISSFEKLIDSSKEVEVLKDFSLMKNDCMLETEFGNINCGLDEQLESLKESMYFVLNNK